MVLRPATISLGNSESFCAGPLECAGRFLGEYFAAFTESSVLEAQLKELFDALRKINHGNVLPLRVGIYANSFKNVPTETACDCAKIACDFERGSFRSRYVYYDSKPPRADCPS